MPYRNTPLVPEQIYHVFNRGVAKQRIFQSNKDYIRFIDLVTYYRFVDILCSYSQFKKIAAEEREKILTNLKQKSNVNVEVLAFCLMPNHFHFLLKQISAKGIQAFMTNIQNGYAKYFNIKNKRVGPLFQSTYKVVRIEADEQLLHVSRYIHLNPCTGFLVDKENLSTYPWSSFSNYVSNNSSKYDFITNSQILAFFKKNQDYNQFVQDQIDYQRELDNIKHLTLE